MKAQEMEVDSQVVVDQQEDRTLVFQLQEDKMMVV